MITGPFLVCLVLAIFAAVFSRHAHNLDTADLHLAHQPGGCPDGICDQP